MIYDNFHKWLIKTEELSVATANQYEKRIEQITFVLNSPEKLSPELVVTYLEELNTSASNYNHFTLALTKYRKYLVSLDIDHLPFTDGLKLKAVPKRLPKPLSIEQINKICNQIPNSLEGLRDRALVEILYCGLRNNECVTLKIEHLEDHTLRIIGKGDKQRLVPVNRIAWLKLVDYILIAHGDEFLIETSGLYGQDVAINMLMANDELKTRPVFILSNGRPLYNKAVHRIVKKYAKQIGIQAHPHMLRHSFATHVLDQGLGNIIALKDVMGHEKLDTTNLYVLVSDSSRNLVNSFHPRERE